MAGKLSAFNGTLGYDIGVVLYNVTGFRILPRAEQGAPGMIKDYKVYVKTTGFGY